MHLSSSWFHLLLLLQACEMDKCNAHVGKGFDYHYHGDPYNCMYSSANYTSTTAHPPLIGWGADGFKWYGRYLSTAAPGYSTALDDCGGHLHDSYPYHYVSWASSFTSYALHSMTVTLAVHLNSCNCIIVSGLHLLPTLS